MIELSDDPLTRSRRERLIEQFLADMVDDVEDEDPVSGDGATFSQERASAVRTRAPCCPEQIRWRASW